MAEVAVNVALVLVQIVSPFLENLNSQRNDLRINIESMTSWLSFMKAFMEDNGERQEISRLQQDQMDKVRGIAYDIEDVLDEFLLHSPPYTFHTHKFSRKIHTFAHQIHNGFPLHGLSTKIAEITRKLDDIKSQTAALIPVGDPNSHPSSSGFRPHTLNRDDEMVGYEKPKTEFTRRLLAGDTRLLTLAVSGPGGSGKTTFVENVFRKQEIRGRFDCHAWVHVSGRCDVDQLLIDLLRRLCDSRAEQYPMEDGSTTSEKLRKYLSGKSYIVAVDDVWKQGDWDRIKNALPDAYRGSRIIVTTRSSDLASVCASSIQHAYSLTNLEWQEGWQLFCRNAFPDSNGECPSDLEDSSEKIVKRCEGLPLAIVAVSGLLKNKPRLPIEWERFHDNLGDETKLSDISNALLRSYMDLSANLKCCFLYFSIFPEDYSVKRGRLIRLWVAERFAVETGNKTAEEVAEEYLNELIQRNLVHVSDWGFDGRPRNCRVLNLILNFIIKKCKDENFASIYAAPGNGTRDQKIRRLSVHNDCAYLRGNSDFDGVRSLFLLRLSNKPVSDFDKHLCKLKLVRALDMQGAPLREFPKVITDLTLLKYLSFRDTRIKTIPSSIERLSYLETLDLKQTEVAELPQEISHLHNLHHLFVYKYSVSHFVEFDSVGGVKLYKGIGNLTNLQELSLVHLGRKGSRILKEMTKLTRLRKLGLMGLKGKHGKDLCAAVESMKELGTLDLRAATKDEFLELGEMTNPPKTLQRLYLKGRLREFPGWISSLHNLLRIGLMWSKMATSPLQALERLPHLKELHLVDCCIEDELIFSSGGFEKLKSIVIEGLTELHTIFIEAEAMALLNKMSIRRCPEMKVCPLGLQHLAELKELTLYGMAEELVGRLRMNGEDREYVGDDVVIHSFTLDNRNHWSFENLSAWSPN